MAGIMDLAMVALLAGGAYYVLVLHPEILQNLGAPAASSSTPSTSTTPCQGKDASGNPCACPAAAVGYAYNGLVYSYASKKKKSSSSSKSSSSKSSSSKSSTSTTPKSTSTTPTSSTCDCSACGGSTPSTSTSTATKGTGANIWCICSGGKWAQDPSQTLKCASVGKTCSASATGAVGYAYSANSFVGNSIADEAYGFNHLNAYHRRGW